MVVTPLVWTLTIVGILALLAFDYVFHVRKAHTPSLREASISKQAVDGLRSLHEYWIASLVALKWRSGESDDDYKERTGGVLQDLQARAEGIRAIVAVVREHTSSKPKTVTREKAPR